MFGWFKRTRAASVPETHLGRLEQGRDNLANGKFDPVIYYQKDSNSMCAVGAMQKTYEDAGVSYTDDPIIPDYIGDIKALDTATAKVSGNSYKRIESMAMITRDKGLVLTVYDHAIMEEAAKQKEAKAKETI